jgi:hypothetical protein
MYKDFFPLSLNKKTLQKQLIHCKCLCSVIMEKVLVYINVSHVKPLSKDYTVELNEYVSKKPATATLRAEDGGRKFVQYVSTAY